ncbi:ankyrin repeat-containing domain protein [Diplogelasinospora grovesii]|uniref:Ankyrin repeat-containing domain protein n=1 Tax=Diplogelasinospora grovesii TaxID=303347 RepID=A0AAN6NBJ5_9PEZI|nr:ankyrin repeat-containing domain protein [Diplogelasinospora grovesii]
MSFGFGVGDFLAVLKLAKQIRTEFASAPSQLKSISNETRSLWIVLEDVEVTLSDNELDDEQQAHVEEILRSCRDVLNELENTLVKYQELDRPGGGLTGRAKRTWKRLRWEPEDIRELRERITSNITLLNTFLGGISSQAIFETQRGVQQLKLRQDDHDRLALLHWLTPTDYAPQQSDLISRRQAGTGQWFLNSEAYQTWLRAAQTRLFCPGIPGAGKTISSAITVHDLGERFQDDPETGLAYIYFNFRQQDQQTIEDVLASLLKQLLRGMTGDSSSGALKHLHDLRKRQHRPSIEELTDGLRSVAGMYSRVYFVMDGLDEASDICRKELLSKLFELQSRCKANILATSRPIPEIVSRFEGSLSLEIRANSEDVEKYLDGHMEQLPSCVRRHPELQKEIKVALSEAVDGMFLLAQIYLSLLDDKLTPKAIRSALTRLKKQNTALGDDFKIQALGSAYDQAMERIRQQRPGVRDLAMQVLSWITCAMRPLMTCELQCALAIELGTSKIDEQNTVEIADMVAICAGLVTVDGESDIIRLAHYTTQEYFQRRQDHWFPDAEARITEALLTYLTFDAFKGGYCSDFDFIVRLDFNPLYDYASSNWAHHARKVPPSSPDSETLHQKVVAFLESTSHVQAAGQPLSLPIFGRSYGPGSDRFQIPPQITMTGLHMAAYFGLDYAVRALLQSRNVDTMDDNDRTPLSYAAGGGHIAVTEHLLANGAQVDLGSGDSCYPWVKTPLAWACEAGHQSIAQQRLEKGVEIDPKDRGGQIALCYAAERGHQAIVQLLLEKGADIKGYWGQTALSHAAHGGHQAIVQLLIEQGADFNLTDEGDWVPLPEAASGGHEAVVQLLLQSGADIESKGPFGKTSLWNAASGGHEAVVQLLLENGADIESKDTYGSTPLSRAARLGHEAIVQLLLQSGADIESKDPSGCTPLAQAIEFGKEGVMRYLLAKGADVNSRDKDGRTPLCIAARQKNPDFAQALLDHGADIHSRDDTGRTPVSVAAISGKERVLTTLLSNNSSGVDTRDHYGSTPLSLAVRHGRTEAVRVLLNTKRVDLDTRDFFGRTPLWYAKTLTLRGGSPEKEAEVVRLLLDSAEQRGISLTPLSDLPPMGEEGTYLRLQESSYSDECGVCTFKLGKYSNRMYFCCSICRVHLLWPELVFAICLDCHKNGARCVGDGQDGHELVLHKFGIPKPTRTKKRRNRRRRKTGTILPV